MDWKYRDPKTGKVFDNIKDALEHYCPSKNIRDVDACAEAARLMGYDVIDDSSTEIDEKPTDAPTTIDDTPTVSCDTTTEEDEMKCYRNGGCGPYEQLSCGECPASKPEYKSGDDEGKTKQDKPRLAYVLGLITGQSFGIRHPGTKEMVSGLSINEDGYLCKDGDVAHNSVGWLCYAINHPESIIRAPRLTEKELAICKAVGAKWVSRDKGVLVVELWRERPEMEGGVTKPTFVADTDCWVADVDCNLFPSVKPGDCICVEDAGNDKDDDNSNL